MIKIFFEQGIYLWYLLSVPLLIISHFFVLKSARFKAMKFSNFYTIKRITGTNPDKIVTRNWLILILKLIILFSIILAISAPTLWYKTLSNEQDFIIAIDTSASMLAKDFEPNRLEAAKVEAKDFVSIIRKDSKIGLIDFAGNAFIDHIPDQDRRKLIEEIDKLVPISTGGTDLAGAIISATNLLMPSEKGRLMIILSDGSNTIDSYNQKTLNVALDYAISNQVIIHTIGIGSTNSTPIGYLPEYYNVTAIYDVKQLMYIANVTEGRFYPGSNENEIEESLQDIINNPVSVYVSKDLTSFFLLSALLFLFLEWALVNSRYRRLP